MSKIKVLVADDDPLSLALLHAQLTTWGFETVVAEDGEKAQKLAMSGSFQMCILDWMMPGMTGLDLCAWIKANLNPAPYVMMLTSRSAPEDMHAGYIAGADDYMTKPINREDLRLRVSNLGRKVSREEASPQQIAHLDPVDLYRRDLNLYTQFQS